jgi:16S rRNA (cytidine1402-2'-O)-methyltransferase
LVASGLPTDSFLYLGYLARKSADRRKQLEEVARLPYTLVFLETPHRLLGSLEDLEDILGDREIAVARELTKVHEEIYRGRINAARDHFQEQSPRGEFTLVIAGHAEEAEVWSREQVTRAVKEGLDGKLPASQLASQLASESGWPKKEVYRLVVALQKGRP